VLAVAVAITLAARADDKQTKLTPEIFAPGIISTQLDELAGSFSADGKSFCFVRRSAYTTTPPISIICFSDFRDGKWSHPEVASFSGTYLDGSPYFSPDGKRLYFGSKRPTESNPKGRDWNIWFVEKFENDWSEPKEIGNPINGPQNDTNPAPVADGTLYFTSDRDSQPGYFHIYRARLTNGHYEQPEKLGPEINSGEAEINPYISADQKVLIFASYRKDALGPSRTSVARSPQTSVRDSYTGGRAWLSCCLLRPKPERNHSGNHQRRDHFNVTGRIWWIALAGW
jgi:hypothetical protein